MKRTVYLIGLLLLTGCASSNVTPLAQDTVLISASAAPACGRQGAQRVALAQAAAETLRRGYDKFIVVGTASESRIGVVGTTPVIGQTNLSGRMMGNTFYGSGSTTYTGGQPIIAGRHDQDFAIKMFRASDPAASNAVDARETLGPEWQAVMDRRTVTCF